MLDRRIDAFIFENHLGQRFEGLPNRVYLNQSDLRDYSWSFDTINNRISRFYRGITSRKIPLVVYCKSGEEAAAVMNRLHELAEADIVAKIPGKIFVGDYYTSGFITASTKSNYLIRKKYCKIELTLTSVDPAWYLERLHPFFPGTESGFVGGVDYPFDYPYDYALSMNGQKIVCNSVGSSAFRLLIYGEATNPAVVINGHTYTVNGTVGKGETLLIDSLNKTITLTTAAGKKINWFDKRGREEYIFEPLPAGQSAVTWSGAFGFELTVVEKRSEPKWT
jgi:hypothetical protein